MNKNKILNKVTLIFVFLVLFFTFFSKVITNINTPKVKVIDPKSGEIHNTIYGYGKIKNKNSVRLYFNYDILIDKFVANIGDSIEVGDPIFILNSNKLRREYKIEELAYLRLYNELFNKRQELLAIDKGNYEVYILKQSIEELKKEKESKEYLYTEGFISKKDFDQVVISLGNSISQLDDLERSQIDKRSNLERTIELLEKELEASRIKKSELELYMEDFNYRSLTKGILAEILVEEGSIVRVDTPIVSIADSTDWIFEARLESTLIDGVTLGDRASIHLTGRESIYGVLIASSGNIDGKSSSLTFQVPNIDLIGKENGYFRLSKRSGEYDLLLPKRSIRGAGRKRFVYIVGSESPIIYKTPVEVLESGDRYSAVTGNIMMEDKIVLSSDRFLDDGTLVIVE